MANSVDPDQTAPIGGSAISSAKEGKSGFIYNLVKSK